MKRNAVVKIFAFLALFWIIVSVVGVWILMFFWNHSYPVEHSLTPEELQRLIESRDLEVFSGASDSVESGSWLGDL